MPTHELPQILTDPLHWRFGRSIGLPAGSNTYTRINEWPVPQCRANDYTTPDNMVPCPPNIVRRLLSPDYVHMCQKGVEVIQQEFPDEVANFDLQVWELYSGDKCPVPWDVRMFLEISGVPCYMPFQGSLSHRAMLSRFHPDPETDYALKSAFIETQMSHLVYDPASALTTITFRKKFARGTTDRILCAFPQSKRGNQDYEEWKTERQEFSMGHDDYAAYIFRGSNMSHFPSREDFIRFIHTPVFQRCLQFMTYLWNQENVPIAINSETKEIIDLHDHNTYRVLREMGVQPLFDDPLSAEK